MIPENSDQCFVKLCPKTINQSMLDFALCWVSYAWSKCIDAIVTLSARELWSLSFGQVDSAWKFAYLRCSWRLPETEWYYGNHMMKPRSPETEEVPLISCCCFWLICFPSSSDNEVRRWRVQAQHQPEDCVGQGNYCLVIQNIQWLGGN